MVLTTKVGKERAFIRGLLLTVFTFGIYQWYWAYKAHHEVYQQFELEREQRDEGIVWLILGLLIPFLAFVYYHKMVSNVEYVRARMRLPSGVTPGKFIGLLIAAAVTTFVIVMFGVFGTILSDPAFTDPGSGGELTPEQEEAFNDAFGRIMGTYFLALLVGGVLAGYAFYLLQSSINEVWRWYDGNLATFTGAGGSPPAYAPPAPSPYSYPTAQQAPPPAAPYPPTAPPPGYPPDGPR